AGTQRPRPGRDLANRDWPQDIDADPGESLPRVRLMPLDSTGREGGRRSAVLGVIGPRPDRRRRGDVAVGADLLVEGGFHEPDVTGGCRQRLSARRKRSCRGAAVPAGGAEAGAWLLPERSQRLTRYAFLRWATVPRQPWGVSSMAE